MATNNAYILNGRIKIGLPSYLRMAKVDLDIEMELKWMGQRLRQLRIQRGFTNYETFAFTHEIPRAQYGRYEQGKDLRVSSLLKVLRAMEVKPEEFFKKDSHDQQSD